MKNVILIFLSVFIYSCQTQSVIQEVINVDLDKKVVDSLENFFEILELWPVESNQTVISDITKVKAYNGNIYILDKMQKKILSVNSDNKKVGDFINKVGLAKDEYVNIEDFDVASDGCIFILDNDSRKIIEYDQNGNYKRTIRSVNGNSIAVSDDGIIGLHNYLTENEENVRVLSSDGKLKYVIRCDDGMVSHKMYNGNEIIAKGNDFYFCNPFDFNLYKIENETKQSVVQFNFGKRQSDIDKIRDMNVKEFIRYFQKNRDITNIEHLNIYDGYAFFSTSNCDQILFEIGTNKVVCLSNMDNPYGILFTSPVTLDKQGYFYIFISESNIRNALIPFMKNGGNAPQIINNITEKEHSKAQYWLLKGKFSAQKK